ncbi:MAG: penicillin-binding protein 1C, partial [Alphaproteobacteria bacterium]|nr:penicillin-binding protein 1C [Alphaproteobacteria bacterium]
MNRLRHALSVVRDHLRRVRLPRPRLVAAAAALIGVLVVLKTLDFVFPPDMTNVEAVSPEVVDHNGVLLRAFLSKGGYWRMKTTVADVSPRYLAMLKAYEDKHFDEHFGV